MTDTTIRHIGPGDKKELQQTARLFRSMYEEMNSYGLMLPLADQGTENWLKGITPTLGRLSLLVCAFHDEQMTGFAHGTLKFLPDYLGNQLTGMVTHIYVEKEFRNEGLAAKLITELEDWFVSKKVNSIDLQVVHGNDNAAAFWEAHGYKPELKQFRKVVR